MFKLFKSVIWNNLAYQNMNIGAKGNHSRPMWSYDLYDPTFNYKKRMICGANFPVSISLIVFLQASSFDINFFSV